MMVPLSFAGHDFLALPEAALFWPAHSALLVADLHFEKASWFGRFGQFLPPHDSLATIDLIETLVARTGARAVWSLGDSFHDAAGEARLPVHARARLVALIARVDWVWITGNHDRGLNGAVGGRRMARPRWTAYSCGMKPNRVIRARKYPAIFTPNCVCPSGAGMFHVVALSGPPRS